MDKKNYLSLFYKEKRAYESNVEKYKKMFNASEKIQIKHVQSLSDPFNTDPVTSTSTFGVLPSTDNHAVLQQILAKFNNLDQRLDNIEINQQILSNGQANIVTNQEAIAKKLEKFEENLTLKPEIMAQTKAVLECKVAFKKVEGLVCRIANEKPDSKLVEAAAMLPLGCVNSVQEMEEKLKDVDFAQAMLKYLEKLKGDSEEIDRIFRCIFTDDLLKLYNWEGRFSRLPFGKLSLCNRILRNVFSKLHAQEFEDDIRKAIESSHNRVKHRKDNIKRKKQILRNEQDTIVSNQEAIAENLEDIEETQHRAYVREDNLEKNQQILRNDQATIVSNQESIAKNIDEIEENEHQAYVREDNIESNQQIFRNDQATIVTYQEEIANNLEPIEENLTLKPEIIAQTKALVEYKESLEEEEALVCRIADEKPDLKLIEPAAMLPLGCVQSVTEMEEKLKDVDFAQAMLKYLQKLKGDSKDIARIMRCIFTDDLLKLYNWRGRFKRLPFGKLFLCNRILRDVFYELPVQAFENSIRKAIESSHNRIKHRANFRKENRKRKKQILRNEQATIASNQEAIAENLEDIEENQHRAYEREGNLERNQQMLINDQATIVSNQETIAKNLEAIKENEHKAYVKEANLERNQQILINEHSIIITNQEAIAKNLDEMEENEHKAYVREANLERNQQIFRNFQATFVTNPEGKAKILEPIDENEHKEANLERNQQILINDHSIIITNQEAIAKNLEEIEENEHKPYVRDTNLEKKQEIFKNFQITFVTNPEGVAKILEPIDENLSGVASMLPLRCVISVNEVEEKLKAADFAQEMLTHVQKLKGTSEDVSRKIIRGLFTDELLQLYNWEGRCKKFPFAKLSICNRILREVFQNLPAQKFEKSIKKAIRQSHSRLKYRIYKKN